MNSSRVYIVHSTTLYTSLHQTHLHYHPTLPLLHIISYAVINHTLILENFTLPITTYPVLPSYRLPTPSLHPPSHSLHTPYTLPTHSQHLPYTLPHTPYTLPTYSLHTTYTLPTLSLHPPYTLLTHSLHLLYTLPTHCLQTPYKLVLHPCPTPPLPSTTFLLHPLPIISLYTPYNPFHFLHPFVPFTSLHALHPCPNTLHPYTLPRPPCDTLFTLPPHSPPPHTHLPGPDVIRALVDERSAIGVE